jgi:hypothetical protein
MPTGVDDEARMKTSQVRTDGADGDAHAHDAGADAEVNDK